MWNYDRALGTESVGAWWQKAQQLNGLPSISGAVPAAGRAGSTPEPWGTNLLGLECTQEHVLWHILSLDTGKTSPEGPPWPSLSMKDGWEWWMRHLVFPKQAAPLSMGKAGQAVVSLHSATLLLVQGCQETLSATKAANSVLPYRW